MTYCRNCKCHINIETESSDTGLCYKCYGQPMTTENKRYYYEHIGPDLYKVFENPRAEDCEVWDLCVCRGEAGELKAKAIVDRLNAHDANNVVSKEWIEENAFDAYSHENGEWECIGDVVSVQDLTTAFLKSKVK